MTDPNMRLKFDLSYTLPRLQIPAMAMYGNDSVSAPLDVVRAADKLLPNIPFHYIDNSGHQMAYDQPKLMVDMLVKFFNS
jgi:pimeloyl-ACP methyl ester carboxylesterase